MTQLRHPLCHQTSSVSPTRQHRVNQLTKNTAQSFSIATIFVFLARSSDHHVWKIYENKGMVLHNVAAFPLPSQSTLICSQWCWCNCRHKDSVNKLINSLMLSTSCSIVREGECKLLKMLASEPPDCILRQEIQLNTCSNLYL